MLCHTLYIVYLELDRPRAFFFFLKELGPRHHSNQVKSRCPRTNAQPYLNSQDYPKVRTSVDPYYRFYRPRRDGRLGRPRDRPRKNPAMLGTEPATSWTKCPRLERLDYRGSLRMMLSRRPTMLMSNSGSRARCAAPAPSSPVLPC